MTQFEEIFAALQAADAHYLRQMKRSAARPQDMVDIEKLALIRELQGDSGENK